MSGIGQNIYNTSLYAQFQSLRQVLLNSCETDWTMDEICKRAYMEKSQFYSYYTTFFKATPKAEILNARIEKAKNLLINEGMQVYQVAESCGFKNTSHFIRYFKNKCQCSPGEFRKKSEKKM
jgi:AraC-like DNA-binding protein